MNALSQTFADLTTALSPKQLPNGIYVERSEYGKSPITGRTAASFQVFWEGRHFYATDRDMALLRTGMTPADLELEEVEDDDKLYREAR